MVTKSPTLILAADLLLAHAPRPDNEGTRWYRLILEMEGFAYRTGWGLGAVWDLVHTGDYTQARAAFDAVDRDPQYTRSTTPLFSEIRALRWVPSPRAPVDPILDSSDVYAQGDGPRQGG